MVGAKSQQDVNLGPMYTPLTNLFEPNQKFQEATLSIMTTALTWLSKGQPKAPNSDFRRFSEIFEVNFSKSENENFGSENGKSEKSEFGNFRFSCFRSFSGWMRVGDEQNEILVLKEGSV